MTPVQPAIATPTLITHITPEVSKQVSVQYDPEEGQWLISDRSGQQLRTQPAPEINAEAIRSLRVMGQK